MSDDKEVAYYSAKVNAWFNTKLEYDKSLLVLSASAIGLLVTLLTTIGVNSFALLLVFFASIISFIVCLITVLTIFSRNAKHLEELIAGRVKDDPILGFLDYLSIISFTLGVLLAAIIGLATATDNFILREANMSDKKDSNQEIIKESFNGASNLGSTIEKKSFNGAHNLIPQKKPDTNSTDNSQSGQNQSPDSGNKK